MTEDEERLIADLASAGIDMVAYIFYIIKRYLGQSARGAWIFRARDTRPISVLPTIVRILQRVIGKILTRAIEPDLPACFHAWTARGRIDDAVIDFNTWVQTLAHTLFVGAHP